LVFSPSAYGGVSGASSALLGIRHNHPNRRALCFHQAHTAEWVTLLSVDVIGKSPDCRDFAFCLESGWLFAEMPNICQKWPPYCYFSKICHALRRLHLVKTPSAAGGRTIRNTWRGGRLDSLTGYYFPIHELITKDKRLNPLIVKLSAIFTSNKWATTHQISTFLSNM
jgi:hypothetical protein